MIKLVVCLALILTPLMASAEGEIEIEKGASDLLKAEGLSRPFTIFDQLLYNLEKETIERAKGFQPQGNDFTPRWYIADAATGSVGYSKTLSRVFVTFDLNVTSMNDPWQEVCSRHIRRMASNMVFPHLADLQDRRMFLQRLLGPMVSVDKTQVDSLQSFLDALVLMGRFDVGARGKSPAYLRSCALDLKTNRMTYHEFKY